MKNLKCIALEWTAQQYNNNVRWSVWDSSDAKRWLPTRLSAWTDKTQIQSKLRWDCRLADHRYKWVPLAIFAILMTVVSIRRWPRAKRGFLALTTMIIILCILPHFHKSLTAAIWPGSYSYLDDYVYIDGVNLMKSVGTQIIAYEKYVRGVGFRIVASGDGATRCIKNEDFIEALRQQGYEIITQATPP